MNVTTYFVGLCKSPLFEAIKWGGVGIVRLLLKNGAQINHRDDKGRNSLELSFRKEGNKAEDLQKLLYAAGETLDMHTCHRRDAHMCRAIKQGMVKVNTWVFILRRYKWHIHAGSWSLVNCWQEGSKLPYKGCS